MAVDSSPTFRDLDDVFLQSQARIWIAEVLHTRFDDQLSICDLLSDGELLFEVSKTLWNMLLIKYMELKSCTARMFVPVDTRKSSGRYRPYSNVDAFLKVCKVMGLSGVDLFSPSDVVEKRNTRKVCVCIRSLSTKARSKQLNVPDFDIVTNTIAMSTDVVRCIRRSLELSSMSGVTCGQSKHARLKHRQTYFATHKQEDGSYVKESDEAKSLFPDTSYLDFLYLESPDKVDEYALTQSIRHSDASNREINKVAHTPRSVLLQYVNGQNQLDDTSSNFCESGCDELTSVSHGGQVLHDHEENSQNIGEINHHISLSDMISFRILTDAALYVSKDCLCHSCMTTESHSSNKLLNDVEASPTSRILDFDFDFDFDAKPEPDDLTTLESTYDKISGLCKQSERQVLELASYSFSPDDAKSVDQDLEYLNKNKNELGHSLVLVKDDVTDIADHMQGNLAGEFSGRYDFCAEDTRKTASKDERAYDGFAKADTNKKNEKKVSSYMAPLLKTVAKGTALIGILFLLHLRSRSDRVIKIENSSQIHWKSNGLGFSKRKEEKIYPV